MNAIMPVSVTLIKLYRTYAPPMVSPYSLYCIVTKPAITCGVARPPSVSLNMNEKQR